jgi:hypothetical protein
MDTEGYVYYINSIGQKKVAREIFLFSFFLLICFEGVEKVLTQP